MNVSKTKELNMMGILSLIHSCVIGEEMEIIVTMVWAIWNRRNKWVMQHHKEQPIGTYNWAVQHFTEYKKANQEQGTREDLDNYPISVVKV